MTAPATKALADVLRVLKGASSVGAAAMHEATSEARAIAAVTEASSTWSEIRNRLIESEVFNGGPTTQQPQRSGERATQTVTIATPPLMDSPRVTTTTTTAPPTTAATTHTSTEGVDRLVPPLKQTVGSADSESCGTDDTLATTPASTPTVTTSTVSQEAEPPTSTTTTTTSSTATTATQTTTTATITPPPPPPQTPHTRKPRRRAPTYAVDRGARETSVPTSKIGRLWEMGGLAASLGAGALSRSVGLSARSEDDGMLSAANAEKFAKTLSRMRGAALKFGQMLSIQDDAIVPPQVQQALARVRHSADIMPGYQMEAVVTSELGPEWMSLVETFDEKPIAAASIGQVHRAVLKDGTEVAMKIQYPNIANSIDSDLTNVTRLLRLSGLLPKGMYIEPTMRVARRELYWETDYEREAACLQLFERLLADQPGVRIPKLIEPLSSKRVITTEYVAADTLDVCADDLNESQRNQVARTILELTLRELFEFSFMQTDPNFANFLYDFETNKVVLLDFGASRQFPRQFVDKYLQVVDAAARVDEEGIVKHSLELGFLTGDESKAMQDIHCEAVLVLGEAFAQDKVFSFHKQAMTKRIASIIPTMLKERLTPPPTESYSLHRKMAGAFLLCSRLQANINCHQLWRETVANYKPGQPDADYGIDSGLDLEDSFRDADSGKK